MAAVWDHRREDFGGCPFVVMTPKYGETKKSNLQLGYMLAANGMNVLRFDHTCQVGESAGDRATFTLGKALEDILGAFDFLEAHFGVRSAGLIASSLSARPAIRAAALDARINHLVSLVGVVNLESTLRVVYGEDIIAAHRAGKRWGVTDNFFGRHADWDAFLADACALGFDTLAGTGEDLESVAAPVVFFSGEDDAWVDTTEVSEVAARARKGSVVLLALTKHEVQENAGHWSKVFEDVVRVVLREAWGLQDGPTHVRAPSQRCLLRENRVERKRLREVLAPDESEASFWTEYLGKYIVLEHVRDFGAYLDLLCELLGPVAPGTRVLDAGCGTGLFGVWMMRQMAQVPDLTEPLTYVGLDLTTHGLSTASTRHASIQAERFRNIAGATQRTVDLFYASADFEQLEKLGAAPAMPPFASGSFDAICCSLVVSYLEKPATFMRELKRLIRPGGRLVISSMKPHCDVSNIYRDFVQSRATHEEVESARTMLGGVREILVKEELGIYVFFSGEELARMVVDAGFEGVQVYTSFGDQAVVVRAVG